MGVQKPEQEKAVSEDRRKEVQRPLEEARQELGKQSWTEMQSMRAGLGVVTVNLDLLLEPETGPSKLQVLEVPHEGTAGRPTRLGDSPRPGMGNEQI